MGANNITRLCFQSARRNCIPYTFETLWNCCLQVSIRAGILNSTESYGRRCLTPLSPHRNYILSWTKQYHFMTSSDRFPVPVRSAVKSNFTSWCCQNLSKRALNALTVQVSTTELGKLFEIFTMRGDFSTAPLSGGNRRKVVRVCVALPASSIIWYWSNSSDALRQER